MKNKWMVMICLALTLSLGSAAVSTPVEASALVKAYKSPKGSFKQPASKPNTGTSKTQPDNTKTNTGATTTPNTSRGLFGGGGFAKGLMLGGLAGLMFGGMFGNMGFMGNLLGLFVNIMGIVILIMIVRSIFSYFTRRRRYDESRRQ